MPWGKKSTDHNTKGLSKQQKSTVRRAQAAVNQEAKRRVQQERTETSRDGNRGTR